MEVLGLNHSEVVAAVARSSDVAEEIPHESSTQQCIEDSDCRPNRKEYKLATHVVEIPREDDPWQWHQDTECYAVPRETTVAQYARKYQYEFQVHHLLPEWLHDKMFINRICGSKFIAEECESQCSVRYIVHLWVYMCICFVAPVVGLATLGSALSTSETTPTWFPYVGAFFYIFFVPTIELFLLLTDTTFGLVFDLDDKALKWLVGITTALCFVCSPVYGMWALASLTEIASVDENMGLYVGAYIYCALSLPLWFVPVWHSYQFTVVGLSRNKMFATTVFAAAGVLTIGAVLGSMIHQVIVGELIWFPYVGVVGLLCVIPSLGGLLYILALIIAKDYLQCFDTMSKLGSYVIVILLVLLFVALTDGMAWKLSGLDFSQPIEQLVDDQFLYGGAICFYVFAVVAALFFMLGCILNCFGCILNSFG